MDNKSLFDTVPFLKSLDSHAGISTLPIKQGGKKQGKETVKPEDGFAKVASRWIAPMVNWDMVSHDRDGMKRRGGQAHKYPIEQFSSALRRTSTPAKNAPQE